MAKLTRRENAPAMHRMSEHVVIGSNGQAIAYGPRHASYADTVAYTHAFKEWRRVNGMYQQNAEIRARNTMPLTALEAAATAAVTLLILFVTTVTTETNTVIWFHEVDGVRLLKSYSSWKSEYDKQQVAAQPKKA